jgi:hypothetical protein
VIDEERMGDPPIRQAMNLDSINRVSRFEVRKGLRRDCRASVAELIGSHRAPTDDWGAHRDTDAWACRIVYALARVEQTMSSQ